MKIKSDKLKDFFRDYRFIVQVLFALLCLWIGIEMHLFIRFLESGGQAKFFNRPPGVDGFLPISSLMSTYLLLKTGIIHNAHPAGLFIFIAIVIMSFIIGKSFCSWLCPVGLISELAANFGEKIFRKRIKMPKVLDYPLRSLKYLLLGFFVYSIFFLMTDASIKAFLDSPYNQVADIKMYYFFADISRLSLIVISSLFLLSIIFRGFWCRYLCPYGAFLGIFSLISPSKIKREESTCINCELCTKVCPSFIKVHKAKVVISDECTSCMSCTDVCPVKDTLNLKLIPARKSINKKAAAITVILIFTAITGAAIITGYWQNSISKEEYLYHLEYLDDYGHPTDAKSVEQFNRNSIRNQ